jgi:perosamine synthetase
MDKNSLTRREFFGKTTAGLAAASVVARGSAAVAGYSSNSGLNGGAAVTGNPNALAMKGGTPVRTTPFPHWPHHEAIDEEYVMKTLKNERWCSFDGEFGPRFEKAYAEAMGAKGAVMTTGGTHTLNMSLELLDIGPGDEVLLTPFTAVATACAVTMTHALPVFVDTELDSFYMDPEDIEHRINENTKAIIPVHIFGGVSQMDKILAIGKKHNIPVIEDACQAHWAQWKEKKAGTMGVVGCFSFNESKLMPGGEGGMMISDRQDLLDKARMFRNFGMNPNDHRPNASEIRSTKYRISDLVPALLLAQLTRLEANCKIREANALYLMEQLKKNVPGILPQARYAETTHQNYWWYGFRYDPKHFSGATREQFAKAVKAEGIGISNYSVAINREPFLEANLSSRGYQRIYSKERLDRYRKENHCPHNDEVCDTNLGFGHPMLGGPRKDMDDIVEAFTKVQKYSDALVS